MPEDIQPRRGLDAASKQPGLGKHAGKRQDMNDDRAGVEES